MNFPTDRIPAGQEERTRIVAKIREWAAVYADMAGLPPLVAEIVAAIADDLEQGNEPEGRWMCCPTCGGDGPDAFEQDFDSGLYEATCGDTWHDRFSGVPYSPTEGPTMGPASLAGPDEPSNEAVHAASTLHGERVNNAPIDSRDIRDMLTVAYLIDFPSGGKAETLTPEEAQALYLIVDETLIRPSNDLNESALAKLRRLASEWSE